MSFIRKISFAALTVGVLFTAFGTLQAKPEFSKKEKAACATCHVGKSKELNDTGKYYKEHKELPAKK